jgi:hypothetical protein
MLWNHSMAMRHTTFLTCAVTTQNVGPRMHIDLACSSRPHWRHTVDWLSVYRACQTAFISKVWLTSQAGQRAFASAVALSSKACSTDRGSKRISGRGSLPNRPPAHEADLDMLNDAGSFWASSPATTKGLQCPGGKLSEGSKFSDKNRHWPVDHSIRAWVMQCNSPAGWSIAAISDARKQGDLASLCSGPGRSQTSDFMCEELA